jgi:hypothetical protein
MRILGMAAAGVCLLAMSAAWNVNPAAATAFRVASSQAPIVLAQNEPKKQAQAEPKKETIKQKVKRVWRNWTGYKFSVGCPAILTLSHSTCTETGKNRDAARSKCIAANPLCSVSDVR